MRPKGNVTARYATVISGYTANEMRFSLPPNLYLKRRHFPPLGEISRYSLFPSLYRAVLGSGFNCLIFRSVSGIWGQLVIGSESWPQNVLAVKVLIELLRTIKKAETL